MFPASAYAACSSTGYTVVFVNGVFDTRAQAEADQRNLEGYLGDFYNNQPITYLVGYNQTHLQGIGDLVETVFPSLDQYDLDTILLQTAPEVTTRKILLVGHSQGAQYVNELYDYLVAHGEPADAVGVYAVATPASFVAGDGMHRTYSGDSVVNSLRGELNFNPLPANLDFTDPYPDVVSDFPGHSFSNAYLAAAPDTIVGDIQKSLASLKADSPSDTGDCFDAPDDTAVHAAQAALYNTGDAVSLGLLDAGEVAVAATETAIDTAHTVLAAVGSVAQKVAADIGVTAGGVNGLLHANEPQYDDTNFEIISKLYGSSLTKEEYDEYILGKPVDQGSAVALAGVSEQTVSQPIQQSSPIVDPPPPDLGPAVPIDPAPGVSPGGSGQTYVPPQSAVVIATTTDEIATGSDDAMSTPATSSIPLLTAAPYGSPVVDNFDSYDGTGWIPFGNRGSYFDATTSSDCHSGGCLTTNEHIDNDFLDDGHRMYKTGIPKEEGSFTIWIKHHLGFQGSSGFIQVCVGMSGNKCDGVSFSFSSAAGDDVWHEYYFAWRDDGTGKDICTLIDDTDPTDCSWQPSETLAAGDAPDTIAISGDGVREDLGDRLWLDDLDN